MLNNLNEYFSLTLINGGDKLVDIDYYTVTDLLALENEIGRGIYAWYLLPPPFGDSSSLKSYHSLFWEKDYDAEIKSKFGEKYSGSLDYELNDAIEKKISNLNFAQTEQQKILRMSSLMFSNPLYIGRSKELKNRLKFHTNALRKALENPKKSGETNEEFSSFFLDSDDESSSFAERVASYLFETLGQESFKNKISLNYFVIKVISIKDENFSNEDIKDLEYYLNRTFRPIIGNI